VKDHKIVTIVGATGAQGGGLARAILADPARVFSVRAVTRRLESGPALALAARGAETVAADLDRAETLRPAFEGADAAFCVTNFWEHHDPERELAQAAAMAQAAKDAGVAHVIWSTLEDARLWVPLESEQMPTLMGRYKVPHFDAKGQANTEFTGRNVPKLLERSIQLADRRASRIPTPELNRFVHDVVASRPPPAKRGRRLRLYYAAQVGRRPPRFAIQVNDRRLITREWAFHLENRLREAYGLEGVPVVIDFVPHTGRRRRRSTAIHEQSI
jgi:hypothetical protein